MTKTNLVLPNLPSAATEEALRGKVCLITGASRTLGATIARAMAANGAQVAINYHQSATAADALCAELSAMGVKSVAIGADVTEPAQVEQLLTATEQQLGPIDMLVNNVGPYVDTPFLDLPLADFDRILAGNVRTTFLLTQAVGRSMKRRGSGNIINIAATVIALHPKCKRRDSHNIPSYGTNLPSQSNNSLDTIFSHGIFLGIWCAIHNNRARLADRRRLEVGVPNMPISNRPTGRDIVCHDM